MTFLVAWRLWLLLGVGGLAGAWVASLHRRKQDTVRFTNVALLDVVAPERPGWRRHLPAALWLAAMVVLVLGFARPARDVKIGRDRATVLLALDVSLSMQATDVDPSRLEVAKTAALDFVDGLPDEVDLGFIAFSGTATVEVAPTEDHEAVRTAIEDAELSEGTAIGEAIFAGLDAIADAPPTDDGSPTPGRLVVLSDGETTQGRPNEEAVSAANEVTVPVDTIAFGTPQGSIEGPDGEETPVPVAPDPLREIAESTAGQFFEADSLDALTDVYQDISTSVGYETEERDISAWFIGAGLLLLATAGLLSLLWSQRLP